MAVVALAAASLGLPLAGLAQEDAAFCPPPDPGLKCAPGNGLTSAGGGAKAPHNDGAGRKWPNVNGIFWQATDSRDRQQIGSPDNDELLGHHGDERLSGAGGNDILWGDWDPKNNTTKQRDYLSGGSGNDWLYPSHGRNTILGRLEAVDRPVGFVGRTEKRRTTHFTIGYIFDIFNRPTWRAGFGANVDYHTQTHELTATYGHKPQTIYAFFRVRT